MFRPGSKRLLALELSEAPSDWSQDFLFVEQQGRVGERLTFLTLGTGTHLERGDKGQP